MIVVHDPHDPLGNIVARLDALHLDVRNTYDGFIAQCPAHDDYNPSLHLTPTETGVLLHCFAGCQTAAVLDE